MKCSKEIKLPYIDRLFGKQHIYVDEMDPVFGESLIYKEN
jgi:hypothetical protein